MSIAKDKVVSIHYTLTDDGGETIDSSAGQDPLFYLHGAQNIIPGLENQLTGKVVGDKLSVKIDPKEGYGELDPGLVMTIDKEELSDAPSLEIGLQFQADTGQGVRIFTVQEIHESTVVVDGNHPLAGQTLNFDVEVMDIRDATREELDHGHVHGPGGHHH